MNDFKLKHVRTGRVFYINKSVSIIGRDTSCDVILALGYPSRLHAKISDLGGELTLEDLDSTNGTFVNNIRINSPTRIKVGDTLKFSTEAFCLLDAEQANKTSRSGKLSSKSTSNASPDINDTIIRKAL